jgi:signal transduction histidine kinase
MILNKFLSKYLPASWNTLAMRLAIRQSLILSVLTVIAMLTLYWLVTRFVLVQINSDLTYTLNQLSRIENQQGSNALIQRLNALINENDLNGQSHRYYLYLSKNNKVLIGSVRHWPDEVKTDGRVRNASFEETDLASSSADVDEGIWPTVATQFPDGSKLLITQSIDSSEQLNDFIMFVMFFLVASTTLLSLLLGWTHGRIILNKIECINQTSRSIENGNLQQRVPINEHSQPDEFDELAEHLNKMLDTIERLMNDIKQNSQNIAHDLKKPLTRVQTQLELLQSRNAISAEDLEPSLNDLKNLNKTFNAILQLGRIESSIPQKNFSNVNLFELCQDLSHVYRDIAKDMKIQWQDSLQTDINIKGDRQLLAQAIINLLENALQYTPENGEINFVLEMKGSAIRLSISNSSAPLSAKQLEAITKPFVRLDESRTTEGNGLGLSLVKAIVKVHGAELKLESSNQFFTAEATFYNV